MTKQLSRKTAKLAEQLRKLSKGRLFRVTFIKRTTGEERVMVCRMGVTKDVTGKGLSYDPKDKGLITVYDMQKKGYRSLPIEGIKEIRLSGEIYVIRKDEE